MSQNFHISSYVNDTTQVEAVQLEAIIGPLDAALGKHTQAYAVAEGPITQNGTTVKWPNIHVFHKRESDGAWVRQLIAANTTGVAVANGNALVTTVDDNDSATLAAPTAQNMDSIATILNDRNKIILLARSPMGSGTGLLFYVALRRNQLLSGTGTLPSGGTSVTVNLPTGYTLASAEYRVMLTGTAANFTARDPYISARTTTSFTVTCTNQANTPTFDWAIEGN
jgi:hypothetical protein